MTYDELVEKAKNAVKKAKSAAKKAGTAVCGEDFAVEIDIFGEGEGAFYIACKNGELSAEPYEYYDHDCRIRANAYVVLSLFAGELDIFSAMNEGELNFEGNIDKAIILVNVMKTAS